MYYDDYREPYLGTYDDEREEPAEDWDCRERIGFADPGGNSALRAASASNPRNLPCPTCGRENMLTPADRARGYQCDRCADADERGGW
jgi:hypothetical protein